jgi:4a-hydroxytetrahydrobiopterin dehydratase
MPEDLLHKKCVPCEGNTPPLKIQEVQALIQQVPGWSLGEDGRSIHRTFTFKEYVEGILFVNEVARIADSEGHHPDLVVTYGKVHVSFTTHAVQGLTLNDFVMATKTNQIQV